MFKKELQLPSGLISSLSVDVRTRKHKVPFDHWVHKRKLLDLICFSLLKWLTKIDNNRSWCWYYVHFLENSTREISGLDKLAPPNNVVEGSHSHVTCWLHSFRRWAFDWDEWVQNVLRSLLTCFYISFVLLIIIKWTLGILQYQFNS